MHDDLAHYRAKSHYLFSMRQFDNLCHLWRTIHIGTQFENNAALVDDTMCKNKITYLMGVKLKLMECN